MPLVLIATIVVLLTVGGGDRVSVWLMPGLPPQLGTMILIATLILITALTLAPTRLLASMVIMGIATALLLVMRVILTACIAALRTLWDRGRSAWRTLRGST